MISDIFVWFSIPKIPRTDCLYTLITSEDQGSYAFSPPWSIESSVYRQSKQIECDSVSLHSTPTRLFRANYRLTGEWLILPKLITPVLISHVASVHLAWRYYDIYCLYILGPHRIWRGTHRMDKADGRDTWSIITILEAAQTGFSFLFSLLFLTDVRLGSSFLHREDREKILVRSGRISQSRYVQLPQHV